MEFWKTFRPWNPQTYAHQTLTPAQVLPEDDLVFFLIELVPQLDLTPFYAYYERETRGAPPFDVAAGLRRDDRVLSVTSARATTRPRNLGARCNPSRKIRA